MTGPGFYEDEIRRKLDVFLTPHRDPVPALSAEEAEFLSSQYEEHTEHARHCETERSTVTTFVLAAQAATFAYLGSKEFACKFWPLALLIPALSAYGLYMCVVLYERFRLHSLFAFAFRNSLERRLPMARVFEIRNAVRDAYPKKYTLHRQWQILHGAIGIISLIWIAIFMVRVRLPSRPCTAGAEMRTIQPTAISVSVENDSVVKVGRFHFAMRLGDDRSDEVPDGLDGTSTATRKEKVRAAFNSPFWPFVLVSTSVGQEGLDFHHYCHAITHWNLPANPVDLEQRDGRIHRYKGHAVRKNIADKLGPQSLAQGNGDVWSEIFALGREQREPHDNDLVPYWVYSGDAKIERYVPVLPLSRDRERFYALRRSLAIYRMVFGQNRQEDLIDFLLTETPEDKREEFVQELQIDLRPPQPKSGSVPDNRFDAL